MKNEVKRYSIIALVYYLLSFMPGLLLFDPNITKTLGEDFRAIIALLVLIICDILLIGMTSSCGIFNEFESFKETFKVTSFASEPREEKDSVLASYIFNFFFYLIPFGASLFVIDACISSGKLTMSMLIAYASMFFNLAMLIAFVVRLNKMFKFMEETAEEDDKWAKVKWDVRKLMLILTFENHRIEFTPAYIKDITFQEFKKMIADEIKKLPSFNEIDDEKKLIVLKENIQSAWIYEAVECTKRYVELD